MPTHAPYTEAYLARMAWRDGPDDYRVCEHNVDLTVTEAACQLQSGAPPKSARAMITDGQAVCAHRRRGATLARAFPTAE